MGHFNLQLALTAPGPPREDIQDKLRPVNDPKFRMIGYRADLRRIQLLVEYQQICIQTERSQHHLAKLPLSQNPLGVYLGASLDKGVQDKNIVRPGKFHQFIHGLLLFCLGRGGDTDQKGPVPPKVDFPDRLKTRKLLLQGGYNLPKCLRLPGRNNRRQDNPVFPVNGSRGKMGRINAFRQPVRPDLDDRDHIKPQEEKIDQIIFRQVLSCKMGMHASEPLEPAAGRPEMGKDRDHDPFIVAGNDLLHLTGPVDQNTKLTTGFLRQGRKLSCQFRADNQIRRDPAIGYTVKPFQLSSFQTVRVSCNFADGTPYWVY